jgi:peptidase E
MIEYMEIVLFGSGEFTEKVDDIDRALIEKYKPRSIAVLPTAAGAEKDVSKWLDMAQQHYAKFQLPVVPVPILNKSHANDEKLVALLDDADWIFFSGGDPDYLFDSLQGSSLWDKVQEKVKGGSVLLGSSAGAMVLGAYIPVFTFKSLYNQKSTKWHKAFGLIDYSVLPHYDQMNKLFKIAERLIEKGPEEVQSAWIGIDENTAVIFNSEEPVVLGHGGVEFHVLEQQYRLIAAANE